MEPEKYKNIGIDFSYDTKQISKFQLNKFENRIYPLQNLKKDFYFRYWFCSRFIIKRNKIKITTC